MERKKENQRCSFQRRPHLSMAPPSVSLICAFAGVWCSPATSSTSVTCGEADTKPADEVWLKSGLCGFGDLAVRGLSPCPEVHRTSNYFCTAGGCTGQRCFKAKERHLSQLRQGWHVFPQPVAEKFPASRQCPASLPELRLFCKLTWSLLLQLQRLRLHKVLWFAVYKPIKKPQMKSPAGKVKSNEVGCCEGW